MPNHQFSRLLSLLCNGFVNTPECLLFPDFLLNIFSTMNMQYFHTTELLNWAPCSWCLLDAPPLIHTLTLIPPAHSCQSTWLECHCHCCCHPADFSCKVFMLWPVSSFPPSAIWDTEPIHLCSPATCSPTNALCSSDHGMTVTSHVLYIPLYIPLPTLSPILYRISISIYIYLY